MLLYPNNRKFITTNCYGVSRQLLVCVWRVWHTSLYVLGQRCVCVVGQRCVCGVCVVVVIYQTKQLSECTFSYFYLGMCAVAFSLAILASSISILNILTSSSAPSMAAPSASNKLLSLFSLSFSLFSL